MCTAWVRLLQELIATVKAARMLSPVKMQVDSTTVDELTYFLFLSQQL